MGVGLSFDVLHALLLVHTQHPHGEGGCPGGVVWVIVWVVVWLVVWMVVCSKVFRIYGEDDEKTWKKHQKMKVWEDCGRFSFLW